MKKTLACIFAAAMVFGMTTVAYAASKTTSISVDDSPYLFVSGEMVPATEFKPGKTFYFPIENLDEDYNNGELNVLTTSAVSGIRVSKDINDGSNIFESVDIVRKKAAGLGDLGYNEDDYTLYIEVVTKSLSSSKSVDVDFVFTLGASSSVEIANDQATLYETFKSGSSNTGSGDGSYTESDYVYDFSDAEGRIDIDFENGVIFNVYVTDQKERYLEYTDDPTDYDAADEVDDRYGSKATLDFHLFLGKTSEKTFATSGKLYIPADKTDYIYEISGDKLRGIEADYDSDEDAFVIRTKTPGYYVISDKQLGDIVTSTGKRAMTEADESSSSSSSSSSSQAPSTNTGGETNPNTGATDMTALAMALVVVSLAGIGVATFKKQTK